jgi:hypothetical protein
LNNPLKFSDPTGENPLILLYLGGRLALQCASNPLCRRAVIGGAVAVAGALQFSNNLSPVNPIRGTTNDPFADFCPEPLRMSIGGGGQDISVPDVHANSHQSPRPTEVYHLINKTTFEIDKIGITALGQSGRYSQAWLEANNVRYQTIREYQSRYPAVVHENIELTHYFLTHFELPKFNKVTR